MTEYPLKISLRAIICVSHSCKQNKQKKHQNVQISQTDIIQAFKQTKSSIWKLSCNCQIDIQTLREFLDEPCENSTDCKNIIINFMSTLEEITPTKCCIQCYVQKNLAIKEENQILKSENDKITKDNIFMENKIKEQQESIQIFVAELQTKIDREEHEEEINKIESKKDKLQAQVKKLESQISKLKTELKVSTESLKQIEQHNNQREFRIKYLEDQIETEKRKYGVLQSNKDGQINVLKEKIKQKTNQLEKILNTQVKKNQEEKQKLNSEEQTEKFVGKELSDKKKADIDFEKEELITYLNEQIEKKEKRILQLQKKIESLERRVEQFSEREKKFMQKFRAQKKFLNESLQNQQRQMEDLLGKNEDDKSEAPPSVSSKNTEHKESSEPEQAPLLSLKVQLNRRLSNTQSNQASSPSTGVSSSGQMDDSIKIGVSKNSVKPKTDEVEQKNHTTQEEEQVFEDINGGEELNDQSIPSIDEKKSKISKIVSSSQPDQSLLNRAKCDQLQNAPSRYVGNQVQTAYTIKSSISQSQNYVIPQNLKVNKTHTPPTSSELNDQIKNVIRDQKQKAFIKKSDSLSTQN